MAKFWTMALLALLIIGGVGSVVTTLAASPAFLFALAAAGAVVAVFVVLCLVCGAVFVARYAAMSFVEVRRANMFVSPDAQGLLPVPEQFMLQPVMAMRALDVHYAKAQQVPHSFTYSVKPGKGNDVIDVLPEVAQPAIVPESFWQLWQGHKLPTNGFLMGYAIDEDGQEVVAGWRDLYGTLVGGKPGMGKSTMIRSILAQSAMQGGKFVIVDPHYNSGEESLGSSLEPLRNLMLCDVASDEQPIIDALAFVSAIGKRRLAGQDPARWPLILVVDETTGLLQRSNVKVQLAEALGQISQETRKVGVYAMCIGQNFKSSIMDTAIRDSFVSMISMRTTRKVAGVQSGSNEFGKLAETLAIGQAVWMAPSGDMQRLAVPNCTAADLELVASHLGGKMPNSDAGTQNYAITPVKAASKPASKPTSTTPSDGNSGVNWGDPTIQSALALMRLGYSQTDILKEAWGIKATSGGKYQKAVEDYRLIIAELAKGAIK